jgi:arsenate reductase (glutaredoxin)
VSLPETGLVLLHNPRCSKSRAAKALLEERGLDFVERRYLEDPLDDAELLDLAGRLGLATLAWTRRGEPAFAESGLHLGSSDAEVRASLAERPVLIERPILIRGERAIVGRPPERILELL